MFIAVRWFFLLAGLILVLAACVPAGSDTTAKVERYSTAPEAKKISVNLLRLEEKVRTEGVSPAVAVANTAIATVDSGVLLDIRTTRLDADVKKKFQLSGVTVRHFSPKYNRVSVIIDDLALLYQLAKIPEVQMINPEYGARTHGGAVSGPKGVKPGK